MLPCLSWCVIENNLQTLYRHPTGNFRVSDKGELSRISDYNLIGRFVKWFKDIISGGEVTKKVNFITYKTFEDTLKLIKESKEHEFYLRIRCPYEEPQIECTAKYVNKVVSNEPLKSHKDIQRIAEKINKTIDKFYKNQPVYPPPTGRRGKDPNCAILGDR